MTDEAAASDATPLHLLIAKVAQHLEQGDDLGWAHDAVAALVARLQQIGLADDPTGTALPPPDFQPYRAAEGSTVDVPELIADQLQIKSLVMLQPDTGRPQVIDGKPVAGAIFRLGLSVPGPLGTPMLRWHPPLMFIGTPQVMRQAAGLARKALVDAADKAERAHHRPGGLAPPV